jgi:Arc/MetJ-type ribon-helix-helix transcriptional regulator
MQKGKEESDLVSARLSPKETEEIEMLVEEGFFMNTADFVRSAVREKLESIKIMDIRNESKEKAEKEIIEYLKKNKKAYPSEIAEALELDFDTVLEIVKGLVETGRLK